MKHENLRFILNGMTGKTVVIEEENDHSYPCLLAFYFSVVPGIEDETTGIVVTL
jgi:hypothetical protein